MGIDIVVCDHGSRVEGTDGGHLSAVLKGLGYNVMYVSRCYTGLEDLAVIAGARAHVIIADPSIHNEGRRGIDSPFLKGLEELCRVRYANLVLVASAPEELGRPGIIDKANPPSVVEKVESYFITQPS